MTEVKREPLIIHAPWCPCGTGLGGSPGTGMPVEAHELAQIVSYPLPPLPETLSHHNIVAR